MVLCLLETLPSGQSGVPTPGGITRPTSVTIASMKSGARNSTQA